MRSHLFLVSFFIALFSPSPAANAQRASEANTASVQRAIDEVWARVIDADRKGDAAALAANYTEDAMVIDPSTPTVTGRANILKLYQNVFSAMKLIDVRRTQTGLEVSGNLAVENGTSTHRVQQAGKPPIESTDRYTVVFKKVHGRWFVSRDVSTPMPEAAK